MLLEDKEGKMSYFGQIVVERSVSDPRGAVEQCDKSVTQEASQVQDRNSDISA